MAAGTDDGGTLLACVPADVLTRRGVLADGDGGGGRRGAGMAALDQVAGKADERDDDDHEHQPLSAGG